MNAQSKITRPLVYERIAAVQGALAKHGIGKDSVNSFDKYKFRGIDAVYNALAPLLAEHGLCVLPRIIERDVQERQSRKGEPMFYVTVTAEFDFVAAEDGSTHTVRTYGEAMDRSDKATNKAMSAAYKYAAFMAFAIPTEGDNDADASTPEVAAAEQVRVPDAEMALLTNLVQATSSNVPALLKHLRIVLPDNNLTFLSQDDYERVKAALNDKLARMAKEETDAKAKEPA